MTCVGCGTPVWNGDQLCSGCANRTGGPTVVADPSVPPGEARVVQGEREVGRIVNLAPSPCAACADKDATIAALRAKLEYVGLK